MLGTLLFLFIFGKSRHRPVSPSQLKANKTETNQLIKLEILYHLLIFFVFIERPLTKSRSLIRKLVCHQSTLYPILAFSYPTVKHGCVHAEQFLRIAVSSFHKLIFFTAPPVISDVLVLSQEDLSLGGDTDIRLKCANFRSRGFPPVSVVWKVCHGTSKQQ